MTAMFINNNDNNNSVIKMIDLCTIKLEVEHNKSVIITDLESVLHGPQRYQLAINSFSIGF